MSIYDLRYTPRSWRPSEPYMTFQGAYSSDRFGLGFDYDPSLGLIATGTYLKRLPRFAFTHFLPCHFVSLSNI